MAISTDIVQAKYDTESHTESYHPTGNIDSLLMKTKDRFSGCILLGLFTLSIDHIANLQNDAWWEEQGMHLMHCG